VQRGRDVTPLQIWIRVVIDALDDARQELGDEQYEVLLDIVACRIAKFYVSRLAVLDDHDERAA
jgi:hypothetical protein